RLVPVCELTPEVALYWRCLCHHLVSLGSAGQQQATDSLLPPPLEFAAYLKGYILSISSPVGDGGDVVEVMADRLRKEFIAQQLVSLAGCLDLSDQAGRSFLLGAIQELLCSASLSPPLASALVAMVTSSVETDNDRRISLVAELISEVRDPVATLAPPPAPDPAQQRRLQLQLASVKVRLHEAREEMELCVSRREFVDAQRLKVTLEELEVEREEIARQQQQQPQQQPQQPQQPEQRVEKSDADTLLRCLSMMAELVKVMPLGRPLQPTVATLLNELVLPGIVNEEPAVRSIAALCLGSCAMQSRELSSQHLGLLFQ
ncbi:unnamed protein product, partial [Lampetra fluviatilis]